jgi:hypothetical protein
LELELATKRKAVPYHLVYQLATVGKFWGSRVLGFVIYKSGSVWNIGKSNENEDWARPMMNSCVGQFKPTMCPTRQRAWDRATAPLGTLDGCRRIGSPTTTVADARVPPPTHLSPLPIKASRAAEASLFVHFFPNGEELLPLLPPTAICRFLVSR